MKTVELESLSPSPALERLLRELDAEGCLLLTANTKAVARMESLPRGGRVRSPGSARGLIIVPSDFAAPLPEMAPFER